MAIENTTFHIRAEQKIGIFYVFFFDLTKFFLLFFCFEYLNELPKRNREHEFFLMKRKPRILRAQIVFLLYLRTKYASFFHLFLFNLTGDDTFDTTI